MALLGLTSMYPLSRFTYMFYDEPEAFWCVCVSGRLNVLANVVRKPMQQIFSEFTGIKSGDQNSFTGTGDVKYHLGTSYDRPTITGKRVHLSLLANPSHLEVRLHLFAGMVLSPVL